MNLSVLRAFDLVSSIFVGFDISERGNHQIIKLFALMFKQISGIPSE